MGLLGVGTLVCICFWRFLYFLDAGCFELGIPIFFFFASAMVLLFQFPLLLSLDSHCSILPMLFKCYLFSLIS